MIAAGVHKYRARPGQLLQNKTLTSELPRSQFEDLDLARIMPGEADFARTVRRAEVGEKERLAHQLALDRAEYLLADRLPGHARGPIDVCRLVDHFAGFCIDLLAWFEMNARNLQIVSFNVVAERRHRRCRRIVRCGA